VILSRSFCVSFWLKVGLLMGALFWMNRTFTVLAPGSILAPVVEYFTLQPLNAAITATVIIIVMLLIIL
jgi:hypothetical protein